MAMKKDSLKGLSEGRQQFELLADHWPHAFPRKAHLVRPLSSGMISELSEKLEWSPAYARGVLMAWKLQSNYCRAILHYIERVRLDGSPSEEIVSDTDRKLAREQLDRMATAKAVRAARLQEQQKAVGSLLRPVREA